METHAFTKHHKSTCQPALGVMDKRKMGNINEHPDTI